MKKIMILLSFLYLVPSLAQARGSDLFTLLKKYEVCLKENSYPHVGMEKQIRINQKSSIRTLMKKYECSIHLTQDIAIQRGQIVVKAGEVQLIAYQEDYINRRMLPKGTHVKLNSIFKLYSNETSTYQGITLLSSAIIAKDSEIAMFYVEDYYERQIQDYKPYDLFFNSRGKLFLECVEPVSKVVH